MIVEDDRQAWRVWPDDFRELADEYPPCPRKSDDYITVSLTQEQADIMTYDEMVKAMLVQK